LISRVAGNSNTILNVTRMLNTNTVEMGNVGAELPNTGCKADRSTGLRGRKGGKGDSRSDKR